MIKRFVRGLRIFFALLKNKMQRKKSLNENSLKKEKGKVTQCEFDSNLYYRGQVVLREAVLQEILYQTLHEDGLTIDPSCAYTSHCSEV